jgi:hypothetical protein
MAAVLCQSVGQLCKACLGCVVLPCKLGCELCGTTCNLCTDILCSPFVPYLFTTLALNIPPAIYGVRGTTTGDCDDASGKMWLLINAILAMLHIAGAFYIVVKIQGNEEVGGGGQQEVITATVNGDRTESKRQSSTGRLQKIFPTAPRSDAENRTLAGSVKRMGQVLCHDAGVAIYIVIACFWFVWQLYGISQVFSIDEDDNDEEGSVCDAREWVIISLGCGFLYMMMVGCAFGCSLCCLKRS